MVTLLAVIYLLQEARGYAKGLVKSHQQKSAINVLHTHRSLSSLPKSHLLNKLLSHLTISTEEIHHIFFTLGFIIIAFAEYGLILFCNSHGNRSDIEISKCLCQKDESISKVKGQRLHSPLNRVHSN